jgi:hypothetical protein
MNAVAADAVLDDAIAVLSEQASEFLCAAHAGLTKDARTVAGTYVRRLRDLALAADADLWSLPAYNANITDWRALATLAGTVIEHTTRAG